MLKTYAYASKEDLIKQKRALNLSTLKCISDMLFKYQKYLSATATSIEESKKLIEAGHEYVTDLNVVKLFRKRK
jgi:hypothetical protein